MCVGFLQIFYFYYFYSLSEKLNKIMLFQDVILQPMTYAYVQNQVSFIANFQCGLCLSFFLYEPICSAFAKVS